MKKDLDIMYLCIDCCQNVNFLILCIFKMAFKFPINKIEIALTNSNLCFIKVPEIYLKTAAKFFLIILVDGLEEFHNL